MSKTGQLNQTGAKTFQKSGKLGQLLPIGFLAFGAGCMGLAVATAFAPPSVAFLAKLAGVMDRVGLDKGPLLMFGALSTAMGFALSRLEKASSGGGAAFDAANFAAANAGSIETQSEILGSVQAELGSIREELSTARIKADEQKSGGPEGNGEGSDPIFRLAASLDQLGAQIDKRIDKARRELIEAVAGVASTVEVSAQQREDGFKTSAADVDSVRMDIADLRAQLTRIATDVTSTKSTVTALETALETAAEAVVPEPVQRVEPAQKVEPVQKVEPMQKVEPKVEAAQKAEPLQMAPPVQSAEPSKPALPVELTEDAPVAKDEPAAPIPAPLQPKESAQQSKQPQFEGFKFEDQNGADSDSDVEKPSLGVNMGSLGSPNPPAPIPKPSDDLGLIDEMHENTANAASDKVDETPPLFPDAFKPNDAQ